MKVSELSESLRTKIGSHDTESANVRSESESLVIESVNLITAR